MGTRESFFVNNFFVGANQRKELKTGRSSYVPVFLHEVPILLETKYRPNYAFLTVSTPNKHGYCSLGIETCAGMVAARNADKIIAVINPNMPSTYGDTFIHISDIDSYVYENTKLPSFKKPEMTEVHRKIGEHLADIIPDGSTLQMGIGAIPDAVLASLGHKKGLGIHTEMFSDNVIPLVEAGVITNENKEFMKHKIVTSFVMGSQKLYDFVDNNPEVLFFDSSVTNNPSIIAQNPKVVAINSAVEVDITGQVCGDSIGKNIYSGVGGQLDFERAAALSEGGIPIIALPSRTNKGKPRIVNTLKEGAGVTTSRMHTHVVCTEYGIRNLFGENLQERSRMLIEIAHPEDREELCKSARERNGVRCCPLGQCAADKVNY